MTARNAIASAVLFAALAACSREDAARDESTDKAAAVQPAPSDALETPPPMPEAVTAPEVARMAGDPALGDEVPPIVGVWRVTRSDGVAPGTTYAFRSDGALVIEDPAGNPPGSGKWRYEDGKLTIEEEGVAYPTDIVRSDADHLTLRSHNPGGTLELELERAPDAMPPRTP